MKETNLNLTPEQAAVLSAPSNNMLVSASAGCGKTFVMKKRITSLIERGLTSVSRILVLTFAKASAADMKDKIRSELLSKAKTDERFKTELSLLSTASISTIHSFCNELIRRYFYALSLPPKFSIITDAREEELIDKTLEKLLDDEYEKSEEDFLNLVTMLAESRSDTGLTNAVKQLYHLSQSLEDPLDFIEKQAAANLLRDDVYQSLLRDNLSAQIVHYKNRFQYFRDSPLLAGADVFVSLCDFYVERYEAALAADSFEEFLENLSSANDPKDKRAWKNLDEEPFKEFLDLRFAAKAFSKDGKSYRTLSSFTENDKTYRALKYLCFVTARFTERYSEEKLKIDCLDYSDLEHYALKLLKNDELLRDAVSRYDYIFVDEYQDTSRIQEAILRRLAQNNMFAVGDEKQSIFAFRECDVEIFRERRRELSDRENFTLTQNFRSSKEILDFVNDVCGTLFDIDGDSYRTHGSFNTESAPASAEPVVISLVSLPEKEAQTPTEIYSVLTGAPEDDFQKAAAEGKLIANKIKATLLKKNQKGKPYDFSDITILLRSLANDYAFTLARTLRENGIPTSFSGDNASYFDFPEVAALYCFMQTVENYKNDYPLITALKSPFCALTDAELLQIRKATPVGFFHEAVTAYLDKSDSLASKLRSVFDYFTKIRDLVTAHGVSFAFKAAINDGFYNRVLAESGGEEKIERVYSFLLLVASFDEEHSLVKTLNAVSRLEKSLKSKNKKRSPSAVNIMTMHASKGLEFPVCFVSAVQRQFNDQFNRERILMSSRLGIAADKYDLDTHTKVPSLALETLSIEEKHQSREEELRLLYVALTRAKEKLFITGIENDKKPFDAPLSPVPLSKPAFYKFRSHLDYLKGALDTFGIKRDELCLVERIPSDNLSVEPALSPTFEGVDESVVELLRQNVSYVYPRMSDTRLPKKQTASSIKRDFFVETNAVYEVPYLSTEDSAALGTLYHKLIELSPKHANRADVEKVLAKLSADGNFDEALFSEIDPEKVVFAKNLPYIDEGDSYYEKPFILLVPAEELNAEYSKREVLMQGVIDHLIFDEATNECIVIDYKYSRVTNENTLKARYAPQLKIYSEAAERILSARVKKTLLVNINTRAVIEM